MPIAVKDCKWEDSHTTVYITVPLKGVKSQKVDIFSTEEYIKVHYPPYIFECFLYAPVFDRKSAATIGNGAVLFKLDKQTPETWTQLQTSGAADRARQVELRQTAVDRSQRKFAEEKEEKEAKNRQNNKLGVSQQMKLEEDDRKMIADAKEAERKQATLELEQWKQQQNDMAQQELDRSKERQLSAEVERKKKENERIAQNKNSSKSKLSGGIFHQEASGQPMRQSGKINVTFTPRVFPTPVRESQTEQEDEWLKKQASARQISQIEDSDLTEEEKNPVWLRDKGNEFFKTGNVHAAVNAYSHAIRLDYKIPSLYSNRSACHLKLGNYMKAVEDSSKAIELLTPHVEQNVASRCKAHVRRGTALCHLELYVEALVEYEVAMKLDRENEQLIADANRIRETIQGSNMATVPSV